MVSVVIKNPNGAILDVFSDTSNRTGLLTIKSSFNVKGGFISSTITVPRKANIAVGVSAFGEVYEDNEKVFCGWVKQFDDPATIQEKNKIIIQSAWERSRATKFTGNYIGETLDTLVDDVVTYLKGLGYILDFTTDLDLSQIYLQEVIYDDKSMGEVFDQILQLVNNEFEQHSIMIDNNLVLSVRLVDTYEDKDYLFESIDYMKGKYVKINPTVNVLSVYTTVKVASINSQVLVATLRNEISVESFGEIADSVTFTNEVDVATAKAMGEAILKYKSANGFAITLNTLTKVGSLDWKRYIIQTEKYESQYAITGGTSLTYWDTDNLLATLAEVDYEVYYTGNQSLKLTMDTGSTGEEIEYNSDYLVGVTAVEVTYKNTANSNALLIAEDSVGNQIIRDLISQDSWSTVTIQPTSGSQDYNLRLVDSVLGARLLGLDDGETPEERKLLKLSTNEVLLDIKSITIRMQSDEGILYIDQLGVKGDTTGYYDEVLESYDTELKSSRFIVTQAKFGQKEQTPIEQLSDSVSRTDILYNNLSSEG